MSGEQSVVIVNPVHSVEGVEPPRAKRKGRPSVTGYQKKERLKTVRESKPIFIGKFELAHHLGGHASSVNRWIADGTLPPPHSRPGEKHPVWLREHFDEYVRTGKWPRAAWEWKS